MKIKETIAKLRIPKHTPYCYVIKKSLKNGMGYAIKSCPYWKQLKYKDVYGNPVYYCKYLKILDTYQGDTLLWDQCKSCGINDDLKNVR